MVIGLNGVQFGLNLTKSDNCIAGGRFGWHEVLLPINHNYNKICDILGFFQLKHKKFQEFFFRWQWKKAIGVHAC